MKFIDNIIKIDKIITFQKDNNFHPLTCGNDSRHQLLKPIVVDGEVLTGCNDCGYLREPPWYFWEMANRLYRKNKILVVSLYILRGLIRWVYTIYYLARIHLVRFYLRYWI